MYPAHIRAVQIGPLKYSSPGELGIFAINDGGPGRRAYVYVEGVRSILAPERNPAQRPVSMPGGSDERFRRSFRSAGGVDQQSLQQAGTETSGPLIVPLPAVSNGESGNAGNATMVRAWRTTPPSRGGGWRDRGPTREPIVPRSPINTRSIGFIGRMPFTATRRRRARFVGRTDRQTAVCLGGKCDDAACSQHAAPPAMRRLGWIGRQENRYRRYGPIDADQNCAAALDAHRSDGADGTKSPAPPVTLLFSRRQRR